MKHVSEYRSGALAAGLAERIAALVEPGRRYQLMQICGGHTHAIYRHGIEDLLPEQIALVHDGLGFDHRPGHLAPNPVIYRTEQRYMKHRQHGSAA